MTTKEQITNILNSFDLDESLKINITKSLLEIDTSKQENKIISVVELIEDSIDRFSDIDKDIDYIEIRPVLDGINLLLEKNTAIRIVDSENKEISTYKCLEEGMNKTNITEINISEDFKLQIALIDDRMLKRLDASEESMIEKLFEELKNRNLINNIEKAIRYNPDKKNEGNDWKKISFEPYYFEEYKDQDLKQKIVEKLRKLISDSLKLVQNNESIKIKGLEAPNVFSVIRYASDKRKKLNLSYTAQILLSKNQLEQLSDSFIQDKDCKVDESKQNALKRILEDPLDGKSTSEADNCFKHENVRFDIFSESEKAKTETDIKRAEIESNIYKYINPNLAKPLVYIPIHLNGAAWMAIYRIRTEKDIDYMSFYRNKISYIGNQIRTRAYETFFWMYRNEMESIFSQNNKELLSKKIERINEYGMALSCFFPYYIPVFPPPTPPSQSINEYLNSIESEQYSFKFNMNKIWANQIDYDNLSVDKYEKRIKRNILRIKSEYEKTEAINQVITAAYGVSHFYGSRLGLYQKFNNRVFKKIVKHCSLSDDILKESNKSENDLNSIKDLSKLFTIISKQYTDKVKGNFFDVISNLTKNENEYLNYSTYDLKDNINTQFRRITEKKDISFVEINSIYIGLYIENKCRPYNDLYDNLLLEILMNFDKSKTKLLEIEYDEQNNILSFKNVFDKNISELDNNFFSEWIEISSEKFWGALLYLHILLKETNTGSIHYCFEKNQEMTYIKIGLKLKGLQYEG